MKCENCGGNLSLEDLTCPHCGTVNKHAQQHVRDMERYHGAFQDTREKVYSVTRKYAGIAVRAGVIAGLLILTVVFAVVGARSYEIKSSLAKSRAERKFAEYSAILDGYLEEEDYLAFHAFAEANDIWGYDSPYEKYMPVLRASSQYAYLYEAILRAYTVRQQEESEEGYAADQIKWTAEQLNYFYDSLDMEQYSYYEDANSQENREALERMEDHVKVLLRTYCGLTPEDAEGLRELSEARRAVLLEERMSSAGYAAGGEGKR